MQILHGKLPKNSCTLCSAVAYYCGAVAPRAIAALLGRFLPRLGPLANASGPFFFPEPDVVHDNGARRLIVCNAPILPRPGTVRGRCTKYRQAHQPEPR